MPLLLIPVKDEKREEVNEGKKMQQFGFKYPFFLLILIGFSTNHCTNGTNPEILPLDEGYKPDHTIEFSHTLHEKIDCKLCHNPNVDGKEEGIPATKVCMNCHKQVTGSSSE